MTYREKYLSPSELISSARNYVRATDFGRNPEYTPQEYVRAKEDGWDGTFNHNYVPMMLPPPRQLTAPTKPRSQSPGRKRPQPPQTARSASSRPRKSKKKNKEGGDGDGGTSSALPDINQKEKDRQARREEDEEKKRRKKAREERRHREQEAQDAADKKQQEAEERRRRKQKEKDSAAKAKKDEEESRRRQREEDEARRQAEAEEKAKRKQQEEEDRARRRKEEEEERKKRKEEEERKRKEEEEEKKRAKEQEKVHSRERAELEKDQEPPARAEIEKDEKSEREKIKLEKGEERKAIDSHEKKLADERAAVEKDEEPIPRIEITSEEDDEREKLRLAMDDAKRAIQDAAAAAADAEKQSERARAALTDDEEPKVRAEIEEEEDDARKRLKLDRAADKAEVERVEKAPTCTHCKKKILDDDFLEGEDSLRLHNDCVDAWENDTLAKCAQCGEVIRDEYIEYKTNEGTENEKVVELHEGECFEKYKLAVAPKCAGCEKPVLDDDPDKLEVDGKFYHSDCAASLSILAPHLSGGCAHCGKKIDDEHFEKIGEDTIHEACIPDYCEKKGLPKCKHCDNYIYNGEPESVPNLRGENDLVHAHCVAGFKLASRPECKLCEAKILDDEATALDDELNKVENSDAKGNLYHVECAQDELDAKASDEKLKEEEEKARNAPIGTCDQCGEEVLRSEEYSKEVKTTGSGDDEEQTTVLLHERCLDEWKDANLPKCKQCGKPIDSDYVEFQIPGSGDSAGETANLHEGECAEAFQKENAPKCTRSGEPILDDDDSAVTLNDKSPSAGAEEVGLCMHCDKPVFNTEDHLTMADEDDEEKIRYLHQRCQDAWQDANTPKCAHCGENITGDYVSVIFGETDYDVHSDCVEAFKAKKEEENAKLCDHCGKPMLGGYVKVELAGVKGSVHEECAEAWEQAQRESNGPVCDHCQKPMTEGYVEVALGDSKAQVHEDCAEGWEAAERKLQEERAATGTGNDEIVEEAQPGDDDYEA